MFLYICYILSFCVAVTVSYKLIKKIGAVNGSDYGLASIVLTFIQNSCVLFVFIDLKWLASTLMCPVCVTEWKGYLGKLSRYVNCEIFTLKFQQSLLSIDISTGMSF